MKNSENRNNRLTSKFKLQTISSSLNIHWIFFGILAVYLLEGCGVKGNPQAPLEPPFLGHGDVGLPKKPKSLKKSNKFDYNRDFEDSFPQEKEFE